MRESNPRVPDRLIAIGDIHGHAGALRRLLEKIQPMPADTIVTLGDCVNRGPDTRGVLDCLIELQPKCHLVPILGNHDDMMLESRNDHNAEGRWMAQGGETTLLSYGEPPDLTNIPDEHWDSLASFLPYYETEEFIFTHANYFWYMSMDQQYEHVQILDASHGHRLHREEIDCPKRVLVTLQEVFPFVRHPVWRWHDAFLFENCPYRLPTDAFEPQCAHLAAYSGVPEAGEFGDF